MLDLRRGTRTRLTSDPAPDSFPFWLPDGDTLLFSRYAVGAGAGFVRAAANGTGTAELLVQINSGIFIATGWSTNRNTRLFQSGPQAWTVGLDGGKPTALLGGLLQGERSSALSPNGRWLAYTSDESGRAEVYVRPFPDVEAGREQISTAGGRRPRWSADGRELFFQSGSSLMAVAVESGTRFTAGPPKALFDAGPRIAAWAVAADGGFLMERVTRGLLQLQIVEHWFEELKARVPAR